MELLAAASVCQNVSPLVSKNPQHFLFINVAGREEMGCGVGDLPNANKVKKKKNVAVDRS